MRFKLWGRLALLAAVAISLPLALSDEAARNEAQELFEQGKKAFFQREYGKAVTALQKALELDPAQLTCKLYLARSYEYSGRTARARAVLEEIVEENPEHVEAGTALGEILVAEGDWAEAVQLLEPLLDYRHDYPIYHMLAEAHYNLEEFKKARKEYEEAVKLNPDSAEDHYQLGNIYLSADLYALASREYVRARELGYESAILHYKLGTGYFNLRNYLGQTQVRSFKGGRPGQIRDGFYILEALPGKEDSFYVCPPNSAIYQVKQAQSMGIEVVDIKFLEANIWLSAKRFKRAYGVYEALEGDIREEDRALYYYYFAHAAFGVRDYDRYLSLLGKGIELDPETYQPTLVDAYVKVAKRFNQAGDTDKYIEFLEKAVLESPQTPSLHLRLASAYQDAERIAEAVVQWKMVLELERDHPQRAELLNLIQKYSAE